MVMTLAVRLVLIALPILFMIAFIPWVRNDWILAGMYLVVIGISSLRYYRRDFIFFAFGFLVLLISEYLFISTGVETFERRSLFGVMPVWLPLLWAYVFVAIKRSVLLFEKYL